MSHSWAQFPIETKRNWHNHANTRLLGDTITLSEDDWHAPSLLPGWTRAHVATHLARGADELCTILQNPTHGWSLRDPDERFHDIEWGADRQGLSIQEDLDSSLGRLADVVDTVTDWNRPIRVGNQYWPLSNLTLIRLHEVLIHHLDLLVGFNPDQIRDEVGHWLFRFIIYHLRNETTPVIEITSNSNTKAVIGRGEPQLHVSGSDTRLWAWLSGRVGADWVEGAEGLEFDPLS